MRETRRQRKYLFKYPIECLNESNLEVIETFLLHSISVVPKSQKQIDNESNNIPFPLKNIVKPDDYSFDTTTISICFDIGIFLGELIIRLDTKIHWQLEIDDEFRDFGQPILTKKGCKFTVNPFSVAKNLAGRIYENTYVDGQVRLAFDTWKKAFSIC